MKRLADFDRPTSAGTALDRLNFIIAMDRARNREDPRAIYFGPETAIVTPAQFETLRRPARKVISKACPWPLLTSAPGPNWMLARAALGNRPDAAAADRSKTASAIRMLTRPAGPRITQTNPAPILLMLLEQEHRIVTGRIQRERSKRPPAGSPNWILISDLQVLATELERSASELANRSPDDYGRVGDSDPALQLDLTGEQYALLSTTLKQRLDTLQPHNYMGKPEAPESP